MAIDIFKWIVLTNQRTLTIIEVEEIEAIEEKASDVTPDVRELLTIRTALHAKDKGSKFSTLGVPLEVRCVSLLLMDVVALTWLP